jgi:tripartite ATP-independent transporter DctM subunit
MTPEAAGITGIIVLFTLLAFRMSIGMALLLVGFLGFGYLGGFKPALAILGRVPYSGSSSYTLSVIPLFMLMGQFIYHSRLGEAIYYATHRWIGHLPGGLAIATIGGCSAFGAISGSSVAAAVTMGTVSLPEMERYKYAASLATGAVAAGGTLGILIPPSLGFIIYGMLTEQSIGTLFIAGIFPGLILTLAFMFTIYIRCRMNPVLGPAASTATWKERFLSLRDVWGVPVLFLIVMGGIYLGIMTPTEAAGVGASGAFLFALGKRQIDWQRLRGSLGETVQYTAMLIFILIGASVFGYFLSISRVPAGLAEWVVASGMHKFSVLASILITYLIIGCFLDPIAMQILLIPIFFPLVVDLGFDPIWFGVITVIGVEMGLITPPLGLNVFVIKGIAKDVPIYTIFAGILPFLFAMWFVVVLLTVFPQIALFLPSLM